MELQRKLQLKLMDIMDYIDAFCAKHSIPYYLVCGSVLGAVRHQGFIPWDDDLDIAMMREDYDRFLSLCEENLDCDRFYLLREHTVEWPLFYSKILMNGTIFREKGAAHKSHEGIFIDIFPLDRVSDNAFAARWQYCCSKILIAQTLAIRGYSTAALHKKVAMWIAGRFSSVKIQDALFKQVCRYNICETKRNAMFFGRIRFKTAIFPIRFLDGQAKLNFEGRMLPVPAMYHEYLKNLYGDYMRLPPKSKQIAHIPEEIFLGESSDEE